MFLDCITESRYVDLEQQIVGGPDEEGDKEREDITYREANKERKRVVAG